MEKNMKCDEKVYSNAFSKVCSPSPFTASWQTLHFKMHFVSWKSQNDWHCEWWRYSGKGDHVSDWIHYSLYLIRAIHFLFLEVCVHELAFSINSLWELLGRIVQGIVGLTAGQSKRWEHQKVGKYWTCANENKSWQPITVRRWQAEAVRNVEFWTPCPISPPRIRMKPSYPPLFPPNWPAGGTDEFSSSLCAKSWAQHDLVSGSGEIISFLWLGKIFIKLCEVHMACRCKTESQVIKTSQKHALTIRLPCVKAVVDFVGSNCQANLYMSLVQRVPCWFWPANPGL